MAEWTTEELAYAAGIIDGEGTITINRAWRMKAGERYAYEVVHVCVSNTDPRMIEWLRSRFGGTVGCYRQSTPKTKAIYRWTLWPKLAEPFLRAIRPYLVIKGEQCDVALALRALVARPGFYGKGRSLPDEVRREKQELRAQILLLNRRGA